MAPILIYVCLMHFPIKICLFNHYFVGVSNSWALKIPVKQFVYFPKYSRQNLSRILINETNNIGPAALPEGLMNSALCVCPFVCKPLFVNIFFWIFCMKIQ